MNSNPCEQYNEFTFYKNGQDDDNTYNDMISSGYLDHSMELVNIFKHDELVGISHHRFASINISIQHWKDTKKRKGFQMKIQRQNRMIDGKSARGTPALNKSAKTYQIKKQLQQQPIHQHNQNENHNHNLIQIQQHQQQSMNIWSPQSQTKIRRGVADKIDFDLN